MPIQPIQIVEIIEPSAQGLARPYKCKASNGFHYFVKGMQSGRCSLYNEWLCGHIGKACGLNIPDFSLVEISPELLRAAPKAMSDIGSGIAFGSQEYAYASWLDPSRIDGVDQEIQKLVLAFDWWIGNTDRTLGNPNLLYDHDHSKLVVIDHNNALDYSLTLDEFCDMHIFGHVAPQVFYDLFTKNEFADRFVQAAACLNDCAALLPNEWCWMNPEQDIPSGFDVKQAIQTLTTKATLTTEATQ